MEIIEILAHPLSAPYEQPRWTAHERMERDQMVLVEVRTDQGLTGYGEVAGGPQKLICDLVRTFAGVIAGMDPLGHVVVPYSPQMSFAEMLAIATGPLYPVQSAFTVRYNTVLNLWDPPNGERVRQLLKGTWKLIAFKTSSSPDDAGSGSPGVFTSNGSDAGVLFDCQPGTFSKAS